MRQTHHRRPGPAGRRQSARTRLTAVAAAVAVGLLGGCGTADLAGDVAADAAKAATRSTPSAGPTSSESDRWVTVRDRKSGMSVQLPKQAKFRSSPWKVAGRTVERRIAAVRSGGPAYAVAVITDDRVPAREGAIPVSKLGGLWSGFAHSVSGGTTFDFRVFDLHQTEVSGHDAMTGRIAWTGYRGKDGFARMSAVSAGNTLVIVQVVGFAKPARAEVEATKVSDGYDRLVEGLDLPKGLGLGTAA